MKRKYAIIGLLLFISGSVGAIIISKTGSKHMNSVIRPAAVSSSPLKATIPFEDAPASGSTASPILSKITPPHKSQNSSAAIVPIDISPNEKEDIVVLAGSDLVDAPSGIDSDLGLIENPSEYASNSGGDSSPISEAIKRLFPDLSFRVFDDPYNQPIIWGYFYCDPCSSTTVPASTVPESTYSLIAGLVFLAIWRVAYKH